MKSSRRGISPKYFVGLAVSLVFLFTVLNNAGYKIRVVDEENVLGTTSGKLTPTPKQKPNQASSCDPSYRLQIGSKGSSVAGWQSYFNMYQGERLTVDGIFGDKTQAAVKRFQIKYGLTPSGVIEGKVCEKAGLTLNSNLTPTPKKYKAGDPKPPKPKYVRPTKTTPR